MSEAKQTRCPHCGSTFRVSETQMAAKGGNVRCGSCLQVFRADLHMVGSQSPAPAEAPTPAAKAKARNTSGFDQDESWALKLLGDEKHEHQDDDDAPKRKSINLDQPVETSWSGENNTRIRLDDDMSELLDHDGGGHLSSDKAEDAVHVISATADESWAQSILAELEQEDKKADHKSKNYGMQVIRDDKPAKAPPRNIRLAAALGEKVDPEMLRAAQEAAKSPAAAPRPPARPATPGGPRPAPKDDELSFTDEDEAFSFLSEDLNLGSTGRVPVTGVVGSANTFNLSQPLADVEAPVQLDAGRRQPIAWKYMVGWTLSCLIALFLLATQFLFFNFDRLAGDPQGRPLLSLLCTPLGIPLPDAPDVTKLKVLNLSVRPDPDADASVVIDALISNSADFYQPFPALKVSFTDRNDQLVAGRIFQPKEYLRGEAKGLHRIPPDTPVHISLAVINPGQQAVNYSVEPLF